MARNVRPVGTPAREVFTGYHQFSFADNVERISISNKPLVNGIVLKVPSSATYTVWVSQNKSMTQGTGEANSGWPLTAGEEYFFPFDNVNKCWMQSDAVPSTVLYYYS